MRRHTTQRLRSAVVVCVAAAVTGCATGPEFVAPEPPSPGRAAVYIYRASSVFGAGVKPEVWVGARSVGAMLNGGYKREEVVPERLLVSSPACRPATTSVVVAPGALAYVQLELVNKTVEYSGRYYFDYGCRLVQRSEAEALAVLRGLRLAP
jgi:hypothetical protein